jgi:hypothetical protein
MFAAKPDLRRAPGIFVDGIAFRRTFDLLPLPTCFSHGKTNFNLVVFDPAALGSLLRLVAGREVDASPVRRKKKMMSPTMF